MQPADYRLVRSNITAGIMIPIKREVFPREMDHSFSFWLYGEKKSMQHISVPLLRSNPCEICDENHHQQSHAHFSLLNVDLHLFQRSLPLFNFNQLSTLYTLLDEDRKSYQSAIEQQYQSYRQILIQLWRMKQH